jgi:hypothetical protein
LGAFQIIAIRSYFCSRKNNKEMTKAEYLALAASHYDELAKLKEKDNFYDYEKGFDEIW